MFEKRVFILIFSILTINVYCQKARLIQGSDKFISINCNDSCVIIYKNYTIITKPHTGSPGEDILVINSKTQSDTNVDIKDNYKAQYFCGLVGDKMLIDAGTYIVRRFYVYDLKTHKINFETSYAKTLTVDNYKISYIYVYMNNKPIILPSETQKKEIEKKGVDYGIVEDRIFDLKSNKIIKAQKTRYSTY